MGSRARHAVHSAAEKFSCLPPEMRRRGRIAISLPARILPFDPKFRHRAEMRIVHNFNRHGLYFCSDLKHHYIGMRVLIDFPACPQARVRKKYLGVVVRVESLPDGSSGIAVRFLFS